MASSTGEGAGVAVWQAEPVDAAMPGATASR